MVIYY